MSPEINFRAGKGDQRSRLTHPLSIPQSVPKVIARVQVSADSSCHSIWLLHGALAAVEQPCLEKLASKENDKRRIVDEIALP